MSDDWDFKIKKDMEVEQIETTPKKKQRKSKKSQSLMLTKARPNRARKTYAVKNNDEQKVSTLFLVAISVRAIALLIDLLILAFSFIVIWEALPLIDLQKTPYLSLLDFIPSTYREIILCYVFYLLFFCLPAALTGKTIGKKIMSIKVVSLTSKKLGFKVALIREALLKPVSLGLIIGLIIPFFNHERRSFHDLICGSVVVRSGT